MNPVYLQIPAPDPLIPQVTARERALAPIPATVPVSPVHLKAPTLPTAQRRLIQRIQEATLHMTTDERRDTLCAIHEYLARCIVGEDVARREVAKRAKDASRKSANALVQLTTPKA